MGMVRPYRTEATGQIWDFFVTTESQDFGLTVLFDSIQCPHHYTGVLGPTQTTG